MKIIKSLLDGKVSNVLYALHDNYPNQFNEISSKLISKTISSEVKNLSKSKFFNSQVNDSIHLKEFNFDSQYKEASAKAPYTMKIIENIGTNPRNGRNKLKTKQSLRPSFITSLNILLNCRTWHCNHFQSIIGLILKNGDADKLCINRLNSLALSVSYNTVISKQVQLGKNFLAPVQEWVKNLKVCKLFI